MTRANDLLARLAASGRGDYQVRDMKAALERGIALYPNGEWQDKQPWSLPFWLPHGADVGTGKTPSTIVYIEIVREFLRSQGDARAEKPVLVVSPATVKFNWLDELHTWLPDLSLADTWILGGGKENRELLLKMLPVVRPKYVVVNYDLVRIHQQEFQQLGTEEDPLFLAIVCDEVHYIKHRDSQRSRAINSVMAHFHVGLSGTLMTNKPDSIWNVVTWIAGPRTFHRRVPGEPAMPNAHCPLPEWQRRQLEWRGDGCDACQFWNAKDQTCQKYMEGKVQKKPHRDPKPEVEVRYRYASRYWGAEDTFKNRYCEVEYGRYGARVTGAKQWMMPELHQRLQEFGMVRWRRSEVLKLDKPLYEHVALQAGPEQANIYNQLRQGFIEMWADDELQGIKEVRSILAQLTYFRRATTLEPRDFMTALQGRRPEFATDIKMPKAGTTGAKQDWLVEFMADELESSNGDNTVKFLIFSEWTDVLNPLLGKLKKELRLDRLVAGQRGRSAGLGQASSDFPMVPAMEVDKPQGYIASLTSDTDQATRQAISKAWNADPQFKAILASGAAFEGINLQGGLPKDGTLYVVCLNFTWMPFQVVQMIGRGWRWGQDAQIVVLFPHVKGTIDEAMAMVLKGKQQAFDAALDGGEQAMAALFEPTTRREALDLLGKGA